MSSAGGAFVRRPAVSAIRRTAAGCIRCRCIHVRSHQTGLLSAFPALLLVADRSPPAVAATSCSGFDSTICQTYAGLLTRVLPMEVYRETARRVSRAMVVSSYLAIGFIVIGYAAQSASAQVLYGSIVGTLTDQTGAVIPKATVTVTNTSTGLVPAGHDGRRRLLFDSEPAGGCVTTCR